MWLWGGSSSATALRDALDISKQDFYSVDHLVALFDSLHAFDSIDERNRESAIEVLRQIAEILVWGEQHNENFFDVFCEQNVLAYFIQIVEHPRVASSIKVQMLQTLSILVQNINRQTAVYYLFSNNHINTLLSTRFDFSDEEISSWFVSFIKSLAQLINADAAKLFLNERAKNFPLYTESVKFFTSNDPMIRTHTRNVTLSVFKVDDRPIRSFITERPIFFSHVSCYLRELWSVTLKNMYTCSSIGEATMINDNLLEIEEMLYYIQDIFNVDVPSITSLLVERLLIYSLIPLAGSVVQEDVYNDGIRKQSRRSECFRRQSMNEVGDVIGINADAAQVGLVGFDNEAFDSRQAMEQGWMPGWITPDDLRGSSALRRGKNKTACEVHHQVDNSRSAAAPSRPNDISVRAIHMNRPPFIRGASDVSNSYYSGTGGSGSTRRTATSQKNENNEVPCGQRTGTATYQRQNLHCLAPLFLLNQTITICQQRDILEPIFVALFSPKIPTSLLKLLTAGPPPPPSAYHYLSDPTKCAGRADLFLPPCSASFDEMIRKDQQIPLTPVVEDGKDEESKCAQCTRMQGRDQPGTTRSFNQTAMPWWERLELLRMASTSIRRIFRVNEDTSESDIAHGSISTCKASADRDHEANSIIHDKCPAVVDNTDTGINDDEWVVNPLQKMLSKVAEGVDMRRSMNDTGILMVGILVESTIRHPVVTQRFLVNIGLLPNAFVDRCLSQGIVPLEIPQCCGSGWSNQGSITSRRLVNAVSESDVWSPEMYGADAATVEEPAQTQNLGIVERILDCIHMHVTEPKLRTITIRVAVVVVARLIVERILRPGMLHVAARTLHHLLDRLNSLRNACAAAAKLSVSSVSHTHTIDIFCIEWEIHRLAPVDTTLLVQDPHLLACPQTLRMRRKSIAVAPYWFVALTDLEVERRSIQLFLLFRRFHDAVSELEGKMAEGMNGVAVASLASRLLLQRVEIPNPLEDVDDVSESKASYRLCSSVPLENKNIIKCVVQCVDRLVPCFCVQDDTELILVVPSRTVPGTGETRMAFPLRNAECRIKRTDPQCLLVILLVFSPVKFDQITSAFTVKSRGTMRPSLTAPPLRDATENHSPSLLEIRILFADTSRCNLVQDLLQNARSKVRRQLAERLDMLLSRRP